MLFELQRLPERRTPAPQPAPHECVMHTRSRNPDCCVRTRCDFSPHRIAQRTYYTLRIGWIMCGRAYLCVVRFRFRFRKYYCEERVLQNQTRINITSLGGDECIIQRTVGWRRRGGESPRVAAATGVLANFGTVNHAHLSREAHTSLVYFIYTWQILRTLHTLTSGTFASERPHR